MADFRYTTAFELAWKEFDFRLAKPTLRAIRVEAARKYRVLYGRPTAWKTAAILKFAKEAGLPVTMLKASVLQPGEVKGFYIIPKK